MKKEDYRINKKLIQLIQNKEFTSFNGFLEKDWNNFLISKIDYSIIELIPSKSTYQEYRIIKPLRGGKLVKLNNELIQINDLIKYRFGKKIF